MNPDPDPHRMPADAIAWLCLFGFILVAFVVGVARSLLTYFFP
jgi:hypothetical protein